MTTVERDNLPALMGDDDLATIADLLRRRAGIKLMLSQKAMLQARLSRRLRHTGMPDFASYVDFVKSEAGVEELRAMVAVLTTNFTQFFRERHHFSFLRDTVLPPLVDAARHGRPLRLWSAGSSSGQEAFSIAITLALAAPDFLQHDIRILATDIDARVIAEGNAALYGRDAMDTVPASIRSQFFVEQEDGFRVIPDLRKIVTFREHNLHEDWPMKRLFDVVFCRNVAIYFGAEAQQRLWRRMQDRLSPGGWLFLGHSERIQAFEGMYLTPAAVTTYRRPADPVHARS